MPTFTSLLTAAFVAVAAVGSAQEYQPKSIEFKGAPEYSDQELLAAAQLKPGMSLSVDAMKDHARILMDSGVFSAIHQYTSVVFHGVDRERHAGLELRGGQQLLIGIFRSTLEFNRFWLILLCGPDGRNGNEGCGEQGSESGHDWQGYQKSDCTHATN